MANYNQNNRERRGGGGGGYRNHQNYHHQQQQRPFDNKSYTKQSSPLESSEPNSDLVCVVCFKPIQFYAIGECDHLCCFECSTRIRVLCRQNDCPICRRDLAKVIFSKFLASYKELDARNRSGLYDKKYRICFTDGEVQQAFFELLDNKCPRCDEKNIPKFDMLREHVRKKHELFYCDICTEHLKIFSSERRCYSRQDLAIHRRVGDPDNVGHRGHPLCEYCDKRFLDKDELFRHLRKEHFFCHFCDADGANQFYGDYNSLRDHFGLEHYLCEEGECEQEQFTAVFRTEIDLRAHRASAHGKNMNKQANKQTRTLELEFTYAPRHREGGMGPGTGLTSSGPTGGRNNHRGGGVNGGSSRGAFDNQREFDALLNDPSLVQHSSKQIDASNEQDFPSLGGTGSNPVFRPNNVSIRQRVFGVAGLARTKENFPALGAEGDSSSGSNYINEGFSSKITASSLLKPSHPTGSGNSNVSGSSRSQLQAGSAGGSKPSTSMMIHVSHRPSTGPVAGSNGKKSSAADFPALPGTGRSANKKIDLYADMENSNGMVNLNAMSARHRGLVDDYVSVSSVVSKVATTAPSTELKKPPNAQTVVPSVNSTKAFPALSESGSANNGLLKSAQWLVANSVSSHNAGGSKGNVSSKKKPVPAPNLKDEATFVNLNALTGKQSAGGGENMKWTTEKNGANSNDKMNNNNEVHSTIKTKGKEKNKPASSGDSRNNKENESNSNSSSRENFPALGSQLGTDFALANLGSGPKRGPPGFENVSVNNSNNNNGTKKVPAPPPGFNNVTLNSVARNVNNLTFTSSSGESYDVLPGTHSYVPPSNAIKRNQWLVTQFQDALKTLDALNEFRTISQIFRDGTNNSEPYYEHCKVALGDRFARIFPELLVLLPNIAKQQELYLVYCQDMRNRRAPNGRGQSVHQLEVCQVCKQVLLRDDLTEHFQSHYMENNFPKLSGNALDDVKKSAWRK